LTGAGIPDIVGVRVRPEMVRQSIYVEVHLWARAIAPPRSCRESSINIRVTALAGTAGLWSVEPVREGSSVKLQAPSLSYKLKSFLDKNPIN